MVEVFLSTKLNNKAHDSWVLQSHFFFFLMSHGSECSLNENYKKIHFGSFDVQINSTGHKAVNLDFEMDF